MKVPLFLRIVQDMLADKTRKRVSEREVNTYCDALAQEIKKSYRPDLVIAIDTGGSVPGEQIAEALNIPVLHLLVRRNITIARRYGLDPMPLRWIMSFYHHYLFQTVKPVVSVQNNTNVSGKKVLIVDDSLHTGATIDVAVEYLTTSGTREIRVALITYVASRKPDFFILPRGNYSFPWSKDYERLTD
jgi:hypoxanthine phosphoribosyltransferase